MAEPDVVRLFLVASPGTEALVAAEARRLLPDAAVEETAGGANLVGPPALIARANLGLRLPSRVILRLGEVSARDFGKLAKGVAALPIARYLPRGAQVTVRASASRCRLYHTGAITERVEQALADSVGAMSSARDDDGSETSFLVLARGLRDVFTISLDTSGALLHQRGWRRNVGQAPLRETLAAALLAIAGHAPDEPLCDPLCGSGTIAIEAALRAIGRAPGLGRRFAFERFVGHDEAAWRSLLDASRAAERPRALPIVAADADEAQLAAARENAIRADVLPHLELTLAPLGKLSPTAGSGLVVTNPPYGRRVGAHGGSLGGLYAELGRMLRGPYSAWRAAILLEDRARIATLGLDGRRAAPLSNGGLRVWVARR